MKALVTGANGFIGSKLCAYLLEQNIVVRAAIRNLKSLPLLNNQVEVFETGDLTQEVDWTNAVKDIDVIFHLAGAVHRERVTDFTIYKFSITDATLRLATQAARHGVKHFIYVSTAAVYGIGCNRPFTEDSPANPQTPYAKAKLEAEKLLLNLAAETKMLITIIRPPLVYGKNSPGNFSKLAAFVNKCPILPLRYANKKRSFIGINNLIRFLHLCATSSFQSNQIFNVTDGHDISTYELCLYIAAILKKRPWFLPIPSFAMHSLLKLIKKESMYDKLFESLCLNTTLAEKSLGWTPLDFKKELEQAIDRK